MLRQLIEKQPTTIIAIISSLIASTTGLIVGINIRGMLQQDQDKQIPQLGKDAPPPATGKEDSLQIVSHSNHTKYKHLLSAISSRARKSPHELNQIILSVREAEERWGIDPILIIAVIESESSYNQKAEGKHKEIGLMQIMPLWRLHFGYTEHELREPRKNILAGAFILQDCLVKAKGNINAALSLYNSGSQNSRLGLEYASKVLRIYYEVNQKIYKRPL
jgi:hypothetical protein